MPLFIPQSSARQGRHQGVLLLRGPHREVEEKGGKESQGLVADTQTPSPAICVANEGVKGLSRNPIQGHLASPRTGQSICKD